MRKYVEQGGSKFHKWQAVRDGTLEKFIEARENGFSLHDFDIKEFAVSIARRTGLENFTVYIQYLKVEKNLRNFQKNRPAILGFIGLRSIPTL